MKLDFQSTTPVPEFKPCNGVYPCNGAHAANGARVIEESHTVNGAHVDTEQTEEARLSAPGI